MGNIIELKHPLIKHLLTQIRDIHTDAYLFRKTVSEIARILFHEALKEEKTEEKTVEIWVGKGTFPTFIEEKYVFIPILRAGLPMLDGLLEVFKNAKSGFLAIKRNEKTFESVLYYDRVPPLKGKTAVILDPMVATGGSLDYAVKVVKEKKPEKIVSLNIVGAPVGLERIKNNHPDITVYIAQIDQKLEKGYIIPGIGDAGDRAFS